MLTRAARSDQTGNERMEICDSCRRKLENGKGYTVRTPRGRVRKCLRCAMIHGPMLRRSLYVALIVGSLLTALNQGDVLLNQGVSGALVWKIPLTYAVPFCVATYGALANARGATDQS